MFYIPTCAGNQPRLPRGTIIHQLFSPENLSLFPQHVVLSLADCPLLHKLKIMTQNSSSSDVGSPVYILPWSQLTELNFTNVKMQLEILPQCVNLVSCFLTIPKVIFQRYNPDIAALPSIRSLTIHHGITSLSQHPICCCVYIPHVRGMSMSVRRHVERGS
jgi:hypothetical protein